YIKNPKPNGYRSYHMIVEVPVFFSDSKTPMKVEIQIRTIAMDFWASEEHDLKYKNENADMHEIEKELLECANDINKIDLRMQHIRDKVYKNL
ncbi:MAG: GTP pyrophosphokinase family protein, partial [Clostridia bacterium]|nr:GTP pyrophosphokinase family protein [Clostridia bacterium]